ncbi:MAG: biopolymer transporter ExbD [Candidatus Aminicenantes bacterium]|nr:biopolymer transporter ExbD [Candidatus Aminicenantes bacterium]
MGFKAGGKEESAIAEPNVVPLCDVLLVLLIIFMVVTPLVQKGIDVTLPTALNTKDMPDNPEVILYIRKDGRMFVNREEVTDENFITVLEEQIMSATDRKLYLKADSDLPYGSIVEIIDNMKDSGIEIVGIITEKRKEKVD